MLGHQWLLFLQFGVAERVVVARARGRPVGKGMDELSQKGRKSSYPNTFGDSQSRAANTNRGFGR